MASSALRAWLAAALLALGLCGAAQAGDGHWNSNEAAHARIERIVDFDSHITVKKNGDMDVTETIDVFSTGDDLRHGLLRDFPTTYRGDGGLLVKTGFDVHAVTRDGKAETYTLERLDNGVRIRIGSADRTLLPGRYRYTISYSTSRQLGFYSDFDELSWNVTGNGWTFPIDHVKATIQLPEAVPILRSAFYTGARGAHGTNARVTAAGDGLVTVETTEPLKVREGLTVAARWRKGVVQPPSRLQIAANHLRDNLHIAVAALGFILLAAYYAWIYVTTRRRTRGQVVPLFEPPGDMSAPAVHFMVHKRHDKLAFTLALIEMIALRSMRVDKSAAFPRFVLLEETAQSRHGLQRDSMLLALLAKLFRTDESFSRSSDSGGRLSDARSLMESQLEIRFDRHFQLHRPLASRGRRLWLLFLAACIATAWIADPEDGKNVTLIAPFLAAPLACLTFIYGSLRERTEGWGGALASALFVVPFQVVPIVMLVRSYADWPLRALPIVLPALMLPVVIRAYRFLRTYTPAGFKIMDEIAGFRQYLTLAEGPRLEAPAGTDEKLQVYERYLPYAIALGVGSKWAAAFAGLTATVAGMAAVQAMQQYYGGHDLLSADPGTGVSGVSAISNDIEAASASSSSSSPGSSGSWSSGSDSSSGGADGGGGSGDGGGGGGGSGW